LIKLERLDKRAISRPPTAVAKTMKPHPPTLTAEDVMTRDPVCVSPGARIRELARILEENEISGAPVVDQNGTLVGVVSKTDMIRRCSEGTEEIPPSYLFEMLSEHPTDSAQGSQEVLPEPLICVDDFMTVDPITVGPREPVPAIARLMNNKGIHRVIVVDDENFPIGIITSLDLLGVFPA
jgi:CBS domain-containing protein